jgi:hypothetical protein
MRRPPNRPRRVAEVPNEEKLPKKSLTAKGADAAEKG